MNGIIQSGNSRTMTSVDLVAIINDLREPGRAVLEHFDFLKKIEKVLGGGVGKFSGTYVHQQNGQTYSCYNLPKREASLMVMSESYAVQAKVYDRMVELESHTPAPAVLSPAEMFLQNAQLLVAIESRAAKMEQAQAALSARLDAVADTAALKECPSTLGFLATIKP